MVYLIWIIVIGSASLTLTRNRERMFGYGTLSVPSVSMCSTLESGDFFIEDTWRYQEHAPARGEIVVFDRGDGSGVTYVKRILGLAGDRIELRNSVAYVNGQPVVEPYLHPKDGLHVFARDFGPMAVGPDEVFVLGDFRDNSLDSRRWGAIPVRQLHGRAQFIWFSYGDGNVRGIRIGNDLRP